MTSGYCSAFCTSHAADVRRVSFFFSHLRVERHVGGTTSRCDRRGWGLAAAFLAGAIAVQAARRTSVSTTVGRLRHWRRRVHHVRLGPQTTLGCLRGPGGGPLLDSVHSVLRQPTKRRLSRAADRTGTAAPSGCGPDARVRPAVHASRHYYVARSPFRHRVSVWGRFPGRSLSVWRRTHRSGSQTALKALEARPPSGSTCRTSGSSITGTRTTTARRRRGSRRPVKYLGRRCGFWPLAATTVARRAAMGESSRTMWREHSGDLRRRLAAPGDGGGLLVQLRRPCLGPSGAIQVGLRSTCFPSRRGGPPGDWTTSWSVRACFPAFRWIRAGTPLRTGVRWTSTWVDVFEHSYSCPSNRSGPSGFSNKICPT